MALASCAARMCSWGRSTGTLGRLSANPAAASASSYRSGHRSSRRHAAVTARAGALPGDGSAQGSKEQRQQTAEEVLTRAVGTALEPLQSELREIKELVQARFDGHGSVVRPNVSKQLPATAPPASRSWGASSRPNPAMNPGVGVVAKRATSKEEVELLELCGKADLTPEDVQRAEVLLTNLGVAPNLLATVKKDPYRNYYKPEQPELTALMLAAERGHTGLVSLLLARGAVAGLANKAGQTPLHVAKNVEVSRLLIAAGADVNAADKDGNTPLHNDDLDSASLRLLLESGADPNAENKEWARPLQASWRLRLEDVELLLQHGADASATDKYGRNALYWRMGEAYCDDNFKILMRLIEAGADINTGKGMLFDEATEIPIDYGTGEALRKLRSMGANGLRGEYWVYKGNTSSGDGMGSNLETRWDLEGSTEVRKLLAGNLLEICQGKAPATAGSAVARVTELLDRGVSPHVAYRNGQSALHLASGSGQVELVRLLLEQGADVEASDVMGHTPLFSACMGGHPDVVKLLLEHGASVKVTDQLAETPLMEAVGHWQGLGKADVTLEEEQRLEAVMELLVKAGADLDHTAMMGESLLHIAVGQNNLVALRWLVKQPGIDLEHNEMDYVGTPITRTVVEVNLEALKILYHAGAKTEDIDSEGPSLLEWAEAPVRWKKEQNQKWEDRVAAGGAVSREGPPNSPEEMAAHERIVEYLKEVLGGASKPK